MLLYFVVCSTDQVESSGVSQEVASALSALAICWVWKEATWGHGPVYTIPRNLSLHKWKWEGEWCVVGQGWADAKVFQPVGV